MGTRNFTRLGGEKVRPSPQFLAQTEAPQTEAPEATATAQPEAPATTSQTSPANPPTKRRSTKEARK